MDYKTAEVQGLKNKIIKLERELEIASVSVSVLEDVTMQRAYVLSQQRDKLCKIKEHNTELERKVQESSEVVADTLAENDALHRELEEIKGTHAAALCYIEYQEGSIKVLQDTLDKRADEINELKNISHNEKDKKILEQGRRINGLINECNLYRDAFFTMRDNLKEQLDSATCPIVCSGKRERKYTTMNR